MKPQRKTLPEAPRPATPVRAESKLIVLPEFTPDEPMGVRAARAMLAAASACELAPHTAGLGFLSPGTAPLVSKARA